MTKEELEKRIKNKESIWFFSIVYMDIFKLIDNWSIEKYDKDGVFGNDGCYYYFKWLFATKKEAQQFLDNVRNRNQENKPHNKENNKKISQEELDIRQDELLWAIEWLKDENLSKKGVLSKLNDRLNHLIDVEKSQKEQ